MDPFSVLLHWNDTIGTLGFALGVRLFAPKLVSLHTPVEPAELLPSERVVQPQLSLARFLGN